MTGVQTCALPIYENAANALSDTGKKFKLYDVKFLDKDGNEVAPNGTVTISFPVGAGYDAAKLALYRINDDASKVLVKGVMENGMYKVVTKTAGNYALIEKNSAENVNNGNEDENNVGKPGNNNSNVPGSPQTGVNAPQTGDNSNIVLWLMLMFASAGMLTVLTLTRKRRNVNE